MIRSIDDCARGGCTVRAHFKVRKARRSLEFALVRTPGKADFGTEEPLRMALFDPNSQRLTWRSPVLHGSPGGEGGTLAKQDDTGHVAVTLGMGAHSSTLYVIDPADGVHVTFFGNQDDQTGSAKAYVTNMPSARAEDLDGDGIFELVVPVDDCAPSCADGTLTEYHYKWDGAVYSRSGCKVFPSGSGKGIVYVRDDPTCRTE
jgi:CubicO group peptidase (beta-lactamase class C family)